MDEEALRSVLRCERCRKLFDKQSTLKRHRYYCRSKKEIAASRSRACFCCVKRKTRCDGRRPACSKCINNGIGCRYPASTSKDKDSTSQRESDESRHGFDPMSPLTGCFPAVGSGLAVERARSVLLRTSLAMPNHDTSNPGDVHIPWDDMSVNFVGFLNDPMNADIVPCLSPSLSDIVRQTAPLQQTFPPPASTIPNGPDHNIRMLVQRPTANAGRQGITGLIFSTLKAYPLKMSRHHTLPPFIHPCILSSGVNENYLEPLNNCSSALRMLSGEVQGSRKLFWKVVRMECEHLCEEHLRLNKWGLLAAMQALAIYIMMRVAEGQTEDNNVDHSLITTVFLVSTQLNNSHSMGDEDLDSSWHDWIFEESKRRICAIFQILNMLVYFQPADLCHLQRAGIVLALLPAKKQIWEAGDELMWRAERERDPDTETAFAMATSGDLIKLHVHPRECLQATSPSRTTASWDEWCAGMDGLGGLVMLSAALISSS